MFLSKKTIGLSFLLDFPRSWPAVGWSPGFHTIAFGSGGFPGENEGKKGFKLDVS